ncbi:hypothetical protein B0H67DRAFT_214835 [Lasiosphaeris hirsuta]|uniref:Uncharacterized protein n=1 Tax=Lasiosphaeris hirsuta TaxID=260670 RepID=A0AA40DT44_9PEZI|nr:hypothetical protein B0H67DRAFT_214835 [Lasiosphaeris hirsuta]
MIRNQEYYADVGGFEGSMGRHNCHVVIAPAGFIALQAFASMGGNPVMTVPMGSYPEGTKVRRNKHCGGLISVAPGIPYIYLSHQHIPSKQLSIALTVEQELTAIRFSLWLYGRRYGESQTKRLRPQ